MLLGVTCIVLMAGDVVSGPEESGLVEQTVGLSFSPSMQRRKAETPIEIFYFGWILAIWARSSANWSCEVSLDWSPAIQSDEGVVPTARGSRAGTVTVVEHQLFVVGSSHGRLRTSRYLLPGSKERKYAGRGTGAA